MDWEDQIQLTDLKLPPEIWLDIFHFVQSIDRQRTQDLLYGRIDPTKLRSKHQTLLSLNATCMFFHVLVRPLLFEKVAFCGNNKDNLRKASELADLLIGDSKCQGWVKEVIIDRWMPSIAEQEEQALVPVFERVCTAWLKLNNIRWLQINHTTLSYAMYAHLYRLSQLKHFICWNISVAYEEQQDAAPEDGSSRSVFELDSSPLTITNITFYNMHAALKTPHAITAIARLALSPSLKFLHLSQSVSASVFCSVAGGDCVYSKLETLELSERIEEHNVYPFFNFLTHCPSLTTLRVASSQTTLPFDISPNACPNLRSFFGSFGIAALMVQGRPVSSVRCFASRGAVLSKGMLEPLARGTVPLLELDISAIKWDNDSLSTIAGSFPRLTSLTVWYENDDIMPWIKEHLPDRIKALPHLELLYLCGTAISLLDNDAILSHPDRRVEREIIERLAEACLNLRKVRLQSNEAVWVKNPRAGGEWACQKP